jgi:hypothetical protein
MTPLEVVTVFALVVMLLGTLVGYYGTALTTRVLTAPTDKHYGKKGQQIEINMQRRVNSGSENSKQIGDLHLCRSDRIIVPQPSERRSMTIQYHCHGLRYEQFSQRLWTFASDDERRGPTWGRRSLPVPPHTTTLVFGNSHTRQLALSWLCQYQHLASTIHQKSSEEVWVHFEHNATLILLTNTPLVYSNDWAELVEENLGMKLSMIDTIVLGHFNGRPDSNKTAFENYMAKKTAELGPNVDFLKYAPPTPWDVAQSYQGDIIAVSPFSKSMMFFTENAFETQRALKTKSNRGKFEVINARQYISRLGECGTDVQDKGNGTITYNGRSYDATLEMCMAAGEARLFGKTRPPHDMHRCVGAGGGHPDLVAWDVMESLWANAKKPVVS